MRSYKMYKLHKNILNVVDMVVRLSDGACIPLYPDNTDYANFKKEINDKSAQLEDADGNLMTSAQAIAYVKELP